MRSTLLWVHRWPTSPIKALAAAARALAVCAAGTGPLAACTAGVQLPEPDAAPADGDAFDAEERGGRTVRPGDDTPSDGGVDPSPPLPEEGGESPVRRLTRTELNNTLADLLGDTTSPADRFLSDDFVGAFDNSAERFSVAPTLVSQLLTAVEDIAARSVPRELFPCDTDGLGHRVCAESWITNMGLRALRRPLSAEELNEYLALYDERRAAGDGYSDSLRTVVTRWLLSPEFLYHLEIGDGTGALTSYEVASRLSYLLWESMPDSLLLEAAAQDSLRDAAAVRAQAERMLNDPRAHNAIWHFHQQWLDIWKLKESFKSPERHPNWEEQAAAAEEETRRYIDHVVFQLGGGVSELLTSRFTFMNGSVGELYGIAPPTDGFQQVSLENTERAGLLTQPAFLAVHGKASRSSPILRGVFVEDRLLCAPPAPPPPGVSAGAVELVEGMTTRQYTAALTASSECQGCHQSINGIGFGLEAFDEVGRYRVTENGIPVDTAGELMFSDAAGTFFGARGLADRLAASSEVAECMARQWFRYAHGRTESGADGRILAELMDRAAVDGGGVLDLVIALTQVETFYRVHGTVDEGG